MASSSIKQQFKSSTGRTFGSITTPNLRTLVEAGLIREKFVMEADRNMMVTLRRFANEYARSGQPKQSIGAILMRHKVLVPELVENTILADVTNGDETKTKRLIHFLAYKATPLFEKMAQDGFFEASAIMSMMSGYMNHREDSSLKVLQQLATPGAGNAINWGITRIIEHEAAQLVVLRGSSRNKAYFMEHNSLLKAMRANEFVDSKRSQVEAVISENDSRPFLAQFEEVWRHYAQQSRYFRIIGKEAPVPEDIRALNVERVNMQQARVIDRPIPSPYERFIDIYGRYHHAEMDPMMLAAIARTVRWYIENGHARLFTGARLVPDRRSNIIHELESIPWAAKAAYPKMQLLKVRGNAFRDSMQGANRMFLTHSQASEANDRHSIPIIGIAPWCNPEKIEKDQPYAMLAADFDVTDGSRHRYRTWCGKNQAASFTGIIDETLRALYEVETLEIARANDIKLIRHRYQRWKPAPVQEAGHGS